MYEIMPIASSLPVKIDLRTQSGPYSDTCMISANHDFAAVDAWLSRYQDKPTTYKAYAKEARRLLMWCMHKCAKPLAKLTVDDIEAYFKFLRNPPKDWCTTRAEIRQSRRYRWKPFIGPLSDAAFQFNVRAINSLFNFLVKSDYLRGNVINLTRVAKQKSLDIDDRRYQVWARMLEDDEWQAMLKVINEMPDATRNEFDVKIRTQFLFALLYLLGLRINEVITSPWSAFRQKDGRWWFFVKGKGDKLGHVPVNDELLEYVKAYRAHIGKESPLPNIYEQDNLIVAKDTGKPYQMRTLYNLVKYVGIVAAESFEDEAKQEKLRKFSPHWLRHLAASHQSKAGVTMNMIRENLRHGSSQTTQIYVHSLEEERHASVRQVCFRGLKPIAPKVSQEEKIVVVIDKIQSLDAVTSVKNFLDDILGSGNNYNLRLVGAESKILDDVKKLKKLGEKLKLGLLAQALTTDTKKMLINRIRRAAEVRLIKLEKIQFMEEGNA